MTDRMGKAMLERRVSRRRLLAAGSTGVLGLASFGWLGCMPGLTPSPPATPTPRPRRPIGQPEQIAQAVKSGMSEWSRHARLANATGLSEDPSLEEMEQVIASLRAQNVSVVEADTVLSDWLTDREFDAVVGAATQFNRMVHAAGMRIVWYYPTLEVISPGGEHGPSFYKSYPDWAQVSIHGQPNVFHGGVVFWVDPGNESVWLSPNGPWREVYLNRVRRLAASGADGLWPDVPLYFSGVASWCDHSPWGREAFRRDTGLEAPTAEDWSERSWIAWRHENLNRFLLDIAAAGRSVNPDFETFVETVTMDYVDATINGLDGAYLRLAEGITHAWEVDVVSESDGMRYATDDDWVCLISMYKYARAASGQKPAWAFSYGLDEDDAAQVMAEVLAAGCNPYEVKTPEKTAGVSAPFRARWYAFVKAHSDRLFEAASAATVALYHSSACRDYDQPVSGTGLFASTVKPPGVAKWWSEIPEESCYTKQWLGEYRGMVKVLLHGHVPFDVLTSPTFRAEDLDDYQVLIAPDWQCVSDDEAAIVRAFVERGGTLLITGPNPSRRNGFGDSRSDYALADLLDFHRDDPTPPRTNRRVGAGRVVHFAELLGWQYLRQTTASAAERLLTAIRAGAPAIVETDADRRVHVEARRWREESLLHFTNLTGVRGPREFRVTPTRFTVRARIPAERSVGAVRVASPDEPGPDLLDLPFQESDGWVEFPLRVQQYSLVVLQWT